MIREAKIADAKRIQSLIRVWADEDRLLPRSLNDIYEKMRDFYVYETNGKIIGTISLHVVWEDLAEIRSLAVDKDHEKEGVGKSLVEKSLETARRLGVKEVFALTFVPEFFIKLGFHEIDKQNLPHKIWKDCLHCHKFPDCDENAVVLTL